MWCGMCGAVCAAGAWQEGEEEEEEETAAVVVVVVCWLTTPGVHFGTFGRRERGQTQMAPGGRPAAGAGACVVPPVPC